jgi:hypothetical protein
MTETIQLHTLGALREALRDYPRLPVYVWVRWHHDDGSYVRVSRAGLAQSENRLAVFNATVDPHCGIYVG